MPDNGVLDPAKIHFCHLVVEILKFMDPYRMMDMTSVLPIPDLKFIKLVRSRNHQSKWTAHILDLFIFINDLFKAQFRHLIVV
jgi:hypothetical protein